MIHLGISQDRYDSGVALTDGRQVLYAANEERFTRRKSQGGLPLLALAAAFRQSGVRPQDVDRIHVAGLMTPPLPVRAFPQLHGLLFHENVRDEPPALSRLIDFALFYTPLAHTSPDSWLRRLSLPLLEPAVRRTLTPPLRRQPIEFVEHHHAHAAAAFHLSGFGEALAITCDGMGDGISMTVARCNGERIERLWSAGSLDSFGRFFEVLTEAFGFIPCRHEGKITGLAGYGDAARVDLPSPFAFVGGQLKYSGPHGRRALAWLRDEVCARYARDDVAAWAQTILESGVVAVAREWLQRTGLRRVVLAGGVFANVKLNQSLHELDAVDELFVCPNMGDGGLSLGAICANGGYGGGITDVFWGDAFDDGELRAALGGTAYESCDDIDDRIAATLAAGEIIGVFRDRMEWGPRALGNRSILAPATDAGVNQRLNTMLERSEFMPFAPAVLAADADLYFENVGAARRAAELMTVCFRATAKMRAEYPAVVHVDGTVRAQLVKPANNPRLHAVLEAYKKRTGRAVVLNTSFNIHEEPIVRTPEEAVAAFRKAGLDALALGEMFVLRQSESPARPL